MNTVMQALLERRSIRSYKLEMVPRELIDEVIKAGLYAPTGKGTQETIIIAVTDKKLRDQLSEANRVIGGWVPGFDPFYGAPVVLIVLGKKDNSNHVYDGSLVMGNLMLAAHSLGLGSCWINRARQEFEQEEYKALLKQLGIEEDYEGIGHCILGYPEGAAPAAAPRKENRVYYI